MQLSHFLVQQKLALLIMNHDFRETLLTDTGNRLSHDANHRKSTR